MRPTRYLAKWSRRDRGLAEGLLTYEASLNPIGLPPHIARDPNRRFGLDEVVDQSMALLEETQAEYQRADGERQYGLRLIVKDEGPIPDRSRDRKGGGADDRPDD